MRLEFRHGLPHQFAPVGQEQHALHAFGAQQDVGQSDRRPCLARAGRHHEKKLALGGVNTLGDSPNGLVLIVAASDVRIDRDALQRLRELALVMQSLQVVPRVEARDLSRRVALTIPELDLFAVREEDKWVLAELRFDEIGIVCSLPLTCQFVSRRALRFNHG
ncbi:hypothetical protein D3C87_1375420 [compost metagenome]